MSVGIDFGTTNSVLATAATDGNVRVARHGRNGGNGNFRSILCFVREGTAPGSPISVKAGPEAMAAYLEYGSDCRLVQSIKTMAANPNFAQTHIFGRKFTIEELIAGILKALRQDVERAIPDLGDAVTAGRPVRFAGRFADEALALERLSAAFAMAGFQEISFVAEPLAAGYKFASGIDEAKLCVVADFGGGTSDFSLVRFTPQSRPHRHGDDRHFRRRHCRRPARLPDHRACRLPGSRARLTLSEHGQAAAGPGALLHALPAVERPLLPTHAGNAARASRPRPSRGRARTPEAAALYDRGRAGLRAVSGGLGGQGRAVGGGKPRSSCSGTGRSRSMRPSPAPISTAGSRAI